MSDSVRPHRRQPTRLLCPWDSLGKNTGVGCHFLLQCMQACWVASVMSDSVQPHGQQPTKLLCPRESLGKNTGLGCHCPLPQCRRPQFNSWVGKIPWSMARLPTPLFLDFPCDSVGKESAHSAGDLGLIPGLGILWRRERLPTPVFWPGEFHGSYSPWGCKESDTTEWLSLSWRIMDECFWYFFVFCFHLFFVFALFCLLVV